MKYDTKIWDDYTQENETFVQEDLSKFIYHTALVLGSKKVLEAGCNIGNNLSAFPVNFDVCGLDLNEKALKKSKERFPSFKFQKGSILDIPYPDSSFDFVFTRGVLIHISPDDIDTAMNQLFRVTRKWILNLEYFGEDNKMIEWKRGDDLLWHRNMKERWGKFDVDIISDLDLPIDLDKGKTRLTLVKIRKDKK